MIKRCVPTFIAKGKIFKDIYESQQAEIDILNNNIQDLIDNLFVETATWGLIYFEKKYNIKINLTDTLENRRSRILARIVGNGQPFNAHTIKTIVKQFTNGDVEIIPHLEEDYFTIKFISTSGIPPKMIDVYESINEVKAAWLGVEYEFKYNTVKDLAQFTVAELSKYTVKQLYTDGSLRKEGNN